MSVLPELILSPRKPPNTQCPIGTCCGTPGYKPCPPANYTVFPPGCPIPVCLAPPAPEPPICPKLYKPVCGSDGKTYSNKCFATQSGVTVQYEGRCTDEDNTDPDNCIPSKCGAAYKCLTIKDPVCGTDGKTYTNPNAADCAGVGIAYPGACKTTAVIPQPPQPPNTRPPKPGPGSEGKCTTEYSPVCDKNSGVTYSNGCSARRSGVTEFTNGRCPPSGPTLFGSPTSGPKPEIIPGQPETPKVPEPNKPNLPGNGAGGGFGGELCPL